MDWFLGIAGAFVVIVFVIYLVVSLRIERQRKDRLRDATNGRCG